MQPGGVPNVAAARALAEEMEGKLQRLLKEAPKLQERARALQTTVKSRDGLVTATVGSHGQLIRLDIDPRIYRRPDARALADTITDTIHRAGTKAQEGIVELFAPLIPREQLEAHMSGDMEAVQEQMRKQMRGEK
ncbi:MAG TPA: YbaB/EbfC family nucleoid-associated protein [Mycobacteriales bacterium]|jgi:DNA-binding protein YbaB|nr:YbaB/EbfC family nucleoid-associated protein [Mycobacteriales bacterium]